MKWLKLTKRIIEAFLFYLAGYLINIEELITKKIATKIL